MARPPKGKPLTFRPIRLDDDVWAECQRLGKEHGTINEGLAAALAALRMQEAQGRVMAETGDPWKALTPDVDEYTRRQQDSRRARKILQQRRRTPLLKPSEKKR